MAKGIKKHIVHAIRKNNIILGWEKKDRYARSERGLVK